MGKVKNGMMLYTQTRDLSNRCLPLFLILDEGVTILIVPLDVGARLF